jgi:uncharacterized surface protein with fasciclin (FAS1) repeats
MKLKRLALAGLLALLAACGQNSQPITEADEPVLGTMSLDGVMRNLDGQEVALNSLASSTRSSGGFFALEPRQTVAPAVRVVHGSPDAPAVDVLVNDKVAIPGLTYQNQAGPASLAAGKYNVKVNAAGSSTTVINADLDLEANKYYAAYAVGLLKNIEPLVLRELPFSISGLAIVRLLHGSPSAPNVDIYLSRPGRNIEKLRPILRNVPFKTVSSYYAALPGKLQVRITPTGTKTVAIDATLDVAKGSIQTVVAADAVGGGAPLGAYVIDELKGDAPALKSIVEIAVGNPDFSSLVGALKSANLVEALSGAGPFTVFAPTNDAFSKLAAVPSGDALKEVLLYHVAAGKFDAKTLLKNGSVKTLQGQVVRVKRMGDKVILNDSVIVTTADIEASNGIVHVIDTVLIPPTPPKSIVEIAAGNPNFSTLVGALSSANLVEALSGEGPFTVFAPTNDAFSKLAAVPSGDALKEVLLYHVATGKFDAKTLLKNGSVKTLQGQVVRVKLVGDKVILNDVVMVTTANIEASNGIIHVIDTVLIPAAPKSIVEIALANPKFSTLVGALKSANLVEALSGAGPFTVFAPTNSAFEKLESIPDGDALKEVLLYHVVAGRFDAAALAGLSEVTTLSGKKVQVAVHGKSIVLNGHVFVIKADVNASNGVIHVIDSVLIPQ